MKSKKCHVICIPFPSHGHVTPMLNLATILHSRFNFHVTFLTTNHVTPRHHLVEASATFAFEPVPDPVDDPNDIASLIDAIVDRKMEGPVKEALARVKARDGGPVFLVSDVGMTSFTADVAEDAGVPMVVLETAGACSMLCYLQFKELINKGLIPLQDTSYLTNGYLDKKIDWIPSLSGITLKDMPTFFRTTNRSDVLVNVIVSNAYRALKSRAILVNTFHELDHHVISDLSNFSPNIYPIGPLHLLAAQQQSPTTEAQHSGYLQWLDSQQPSSVLYVSFGTIVVPTQSQLAEFASGLAHSNQRFLWVLRSDFDTDGLRKATEGQGMVVSWCDQDRVLGHPSVGGFLTHCGWNSTVESISHGVPMICWPRVADQVANSWYCCEILGVGMRLNEEVKSKEVEMVVRELMVGVKGKKMKERIMELGKLAKEAAIVPHGSSYCSLVNAIEHVLDHLD